MRNQRDQRFTPLSILLRIGLLILLSNFAAGQQNLTTREREEIKRREEWFMQGRQNEDGILPASLRQRAFEQKIQMSSIQRARASNLELAPLAHWRSLGPAPINSDSFGNRFLSYGNVVGRVTAVAVDQSDPTGNTVLVGGAYGGVWKSSNAADPNPAAVAWTSLTDDQATLSTGAIAISPGNHNIVLVGTGEPDSTLDSYYGLGILRSTDGGATWNLITTTNNGQNTLQGLGFARFAFSTSDPNLVVAATGHTIGQKDGAVNSNTAALGLLYSQDAGATWKIGLPGMDATDVVYDQSSNQFIAVIRRNPLLGTVTLPGLYVSSNGVQW